MDPGRLTLLLALDVASAVLVVYWWFGLMRVIRTMRTIPTARDAVAMANRSPPTASVCVIVPAHNEARSIGPLIASLKIQDHSPISFVLCLDRCTDGTGRLATDAIGSDTRFQVLDIAQCPEGWAGKVNALCQGVRSSRAARTADVLLFADADTVLHPSCVRATTALLEQRSLDLLSLLSTLTSDRWFEKLVQPAASIEMVVQYPIARANDRLNPRAFANGQYLMMRRDAYEALGGHALVKDELLEDLALARRCAEAGRPAGLFLADGMVTCRMYDSWPAFVRGWKRIYTEAAKLKPARLTRAAVRAALLPAILPLLALANIAVSAAVLGEHPWIGGIGVALGVAAVLLTLAVVTVGYRLGRSPLWAAPLHWFGALCVAGILWGAARDLRAGRPVQWGGRSYTRAAR